MKKFNLRIQDEVNIEDQSFYFNLENKSEKLFIVVQANLNNPFIAKLLTIFSEIYPTTTLPDSLSFDLNKYKVKIKY